MAILVTNSIKMDKIIALKNTYSAGISISLIIGFAALYLSSHYGVPAMLMALLLGMSFNFINSDDTYSEGLEFCAKTVLRIGVALLGVRITVGEIASLGMTPILMVCLAVATTIIFGMLCARKMGFSSEFGLLTGGAVAICGASAAMAISAVLPQNEENKRNTLFTVIAVTTLSTVAMIIYPLLASILSLNTNEIGFFLGGSIHDVAQVVGAGYSVSEEAGDMSTFIKLIRVATLVPIVLIASMFLMKKSSNKDGSKIKVPLFLIGFVVVFLINSTGFIPVGTVEVLTAMSSKMLLFSVAALGVRTSLKDVLTVGLKPIILVVVETLFIAFVILCCIYISR